MSKREEFNLALKEAMRNKDSLGVSTLRLMLAALKDRDIAAREKGKSDGIEDAEILQMLQSMIKQRQESAKTYSEAGRDDLAEREEMETDIIKSFLPKQLDDSQVETIITEIMAEVGASGVRDMGKIMAALKAKYAGQVDMGKAGEIAKKKLA